jgi:hypothetical protein
MAGRTHHIDRDNRYDVALRNFLHPVPAPCATGRVSRVLLAHVTTPSPHHHGRIVALRKAATALATRGERAYPGVRAGSHLMTRRRRENENRLAN